MDVPVNVLVVDDEEGITNIISRLLAKGGYHPLVAANGLAALEVLKQHRVDIVLTDILMPGMNGLELIEKIKEGSPATPVIVLTAHGNYDMAVDALNRGAFYFIDKPFSSETILSVVKKAMGVLQSMLEHLPVACYAAHSLRYRLPSDPNLVSGVAGQVSHVCGFFGYPNRAAQFAVPLAVNELLANAMTHGNGRAPDKSVLLSADIGHVECVITVEDEGEGFDHTLLPETFSEEGLMKESGRGILMVRYYMDDLKYEKNGTRAVCVLKNRADGAGTMDAA